MDRFASITAFVRVAESGGFSAAGRRLNLSKATVSDHVQALENALGVRLLNRTTRRVSLTEIGRSYYERCVQILHDLEEADEAAGAQQATPRGQLRVHCQQGIVRFVAPVVIDFLARYPEASVDLRTGHAMIDLVRRRSTWRSARFRRPTRPLSDGAWRHCSLVLCWRPGLPRTSIRRRNPRPTSPAHNCLRYPYAPEFAEEWHFLDAGQSGCGARIGKPDQQQPRYHARRCRSRHRSGADGAVPGCRSACLGRAGAAAARLPNAGVGDQCVLSSSPALERQGARVHRHAGHRFVEHEHQLRPSGS